MSPKKSSNLLYPYSVRVDAKDRVYVTDTYNHRIRRVEQDGTLMTALASPDGKMVRYPTDLVFGPDGDTYVVDSDNNQITCKSGKSGLLKPRKEVDVNDGKPGSMASPTQMDFYEGKLYISDTMRDRILILDPETFAGTSIPVKRPLGLTVNRKTGLIAFTQRGSNRVFTWRDGEAHVLAGTMIFGFTDGKDSATFHEPYGLASSAEGNIIVADAGNHAIRFIDQEGIVTTLAGKRVKGSEDGPDATFNYPMGVTVATDGSIFVADTYNNAVRRIWPDLSVETVV
jgi:DNA-binding beta-propeller fold protein YncE